VGQGKSGELVDVVGWRLDDVVQLIRGPLGSSVRLSVQPGNAAPGTAEKVVTLPRSKITLEAQAAKKEVRTIQRGDEKLKVGIINVPSFYQDYNARAAGDDDYRSTTKDVRRLIDELKAEGGVDSLVLDLRSNGGGHLSEAIGLVNLFVPKGPVVQLKETGGRTEVLESEDRWRRLRRAAHDPRRSLQCLGIGDLCRRDAGLRPRHRDRAGNLRQGLGAEPLPARSLRARPGPRIRAADGHDRHVLPGHRREHAESRRPAGPAAAVGDQRRGCR
jgi:hypothetical protein